MLTLSQIAAIVGLLMAFGVDPSEVSKIEILLKPPVLGAITTPTAITTTATYAPTYSTPTAETPTPKVVTPSISIAPPVTTPIAPVEPKTKVKPLGIGPRSSEYIFINDTGEQVFYKKIRVRLNEPDTVQVYIYNGNTVVAEAVLPAGESEIPFTSQWGDYLLLQKGETPIRIEAETTTAEIIELIK